MISVSIFKDGKDADINQFSEGELEEAHEEARTLLDMITQREIELEELQ